MSLINEFDCKKTVTILSFAPEILKAARDRESSIKRILNIKSRAGWKRGKPFFDEVSGFCVRIDFLNRHIVTVGHKQKNPVLTYTCNNEEGLAHALSCKVDGILTNDPEWLTNQLMSIH